MSEQETEILVEENDNEEDDETMSEPKGNGPPSFAPSTAAFGRQAGAGDCPMCSGNEHNSNGGGFTGHVYVLGRIEPRFPTIAIEKEFAQTVGRGETAGKSDQQVFQSVLADRANRHLARQLCWVLTVQGLETYLLVPRDPTDFALLIDAIRAEPGPGDIDLVIGMKGPVAPPEMCNGLMVPIVAFDQIYSFDRESLIGSIPRPKGAEGKGRPAASELFDRMMLMTDNAGATDEHRALNYLAVRYPEIYTRAADQSKKDASLTGVEVRPSSLSGVRNIVEVIFSYTNRKTDFEERFFVRVDVTEEFPFLVTKLSPYFER